MGESRKKKRMRLGMEPCGTLGGRERGMMIFLLARSNENQSLPMLMVDEDDMIYCVQDGTELFFQKG